MPRSLSLFLWVPLFFFPKIISPNRDDHWSNVRYKGR